MEEPGRDVGLLFPTMPDMVVHGDYLHGHGHGIVSQTRGRERENRGREEGDGGSSGACHRWLGLRSGGTRRWTPRRRWKTGELLDIDGVRRRPLSVPWRRRGAWARGQCENIWREGERKEMEGVAGLVTGG